MKARVVAWTEFESFVRVKKCVVALYSFRRDVLSSVPSASQSSQMSLQQVFAILSGTQVSSVTLSVSATRVTLVICKYNVK